MSFWLQDDVGNAAAIGAVITINYNKSSQRKELKMSGGFMSFDNPIVHFGLGSVESIDSVSVLWPDGTVADYAGELAADRFYRIRRRVSSAD